MTKALVLSVKPAYAELILSGQKTIEYRKNMPRPNTASIYFHVCGEDPNYVQGLAIYLDCISGTPEDVWKLTQSEGKVKEKAFFEYYRDSKEAFALRLDNARRLNFPIPIEQFGLKRVPQSMAYVRLST